MSGGPLGSITASPDVITRRRRAGPGAPLPRRRFPESSAPELRRDGSGGSSRMPKAKGKKFNYRLDRKKLRRKARKKAAPRIVCEQIRNAWDDSKSVARNLAEMGLSVNPNKTLPIQQAKVTEMEVDCTKPGVVIRKPYVLEGLLAEASLPEKSSKGISSDMVEYVRYMIRNYGKNYKKMARDEKNYYQDTPKQIKRKIEMYQRYLPDDFSSLSASCEHGEMEQKLST
uniref:Nucleolar protein 16 n=1 Tax=Geotrypetes seraphini TaxID=260995 RepID=A0A6P8P360_GEOSA|nr:nucleolar protein 16 [Geotrypetes seraphini]